MEEKGAPLAQIRYRISQEQYLDFNHSIAEQNHKTQRRKSMLMGTVEAVIGLLFVFSLLFASEEKKATINYYTMYLVIGIVLVVLGLYGVVFYQLIFPAQLKKAAIKTYQKSEYLRGEIQVDFYEDYLYEESGTYSDSVSWENTEGFRETPTLLQVMLSGTRCILIPKKQIPGQVVELRELFQSVAQRYNLKYQKVDV